MTTFVQKIDKAGEFRLKIEQRPLLVQRASVGSLELIIIFTFMILSLYLLALAVDQVDNLPVAVFVLMVVSLTIYAGLYSSYSTLIGLDAVTCSSRGPFFVTTASWTQKLDQYSHVAGKRYYSYFLALDTPQLVREVVLHHSSSRDFDVVLCRMVCEKAEDAEQAILWHNEWHKACMLFSQPVLDIVDGNQKKIDRVQIASALGDGGAVKGPGIYR